MIDNGSFNKVTIQSLLQINVTDYSLSNKGLPIIGLSKIAIIKKRLFKTYMLYILMRLQNKKLTKIVKFANYI